MKIVKIILYYFESIRNFFFLKLLNKPILKQEILLKKALIEEGIDLSTVKIVCYHDIGVSKVNGISFGIKYPKSIFNKVSNLITKKKKYDFYFNGNTNDSGKRKILLAPFKNLGNSLIISSNDGRKLKNKGKFNFDYFKKFAQSKYGLCPHQMDWDSSTDNMWTYRFIESCFAGAIPVLFKETPLGKKFINKFFFVWNDEILKNKSLEYKKEMALRNHELAKTIFCFSHAEIKLIKSSIIKFKK